MAVTILKTKVKSQSKATELEAKVDRLGELDILLEDAKELLKERESIRKELASVADQYDPTEEVTLQGLEFKVIFSKASEKRSIPDIEAFFHAVGSETFTKVVEIPVKKAEAVLSAQEAAALIVKTTGSRTLKAVTEL